MPGESRAAYSPRGSAVANCAFCAIAAGKASAREVYRDDDFVAFFEVSGVPAGSDLAVDIYPAITTQAQLERVEGKLTVTEIK